MIFDVVGLVILLGIFWVSIMLWLEYGVEVPVIEYDEYDLLKNYNSVDIGFLWKGEITNQNVVSLVLYLASKGYIKIQDAGKRSEYTNKNEFYLIKLKDYNGKNKIEKIFMKELFKKSKKRAFKSIGTIVTQLKTGDIFDDTIFHKYSSIGER